MTEIQNRFRGYLSQQKPDLNKSRHASTPSFKGHKLVEDAKGEKHFEMFLPDADNNVELECYKVKKDNDGNYHVDSKKTEIKTVRKEGILKIWDIPVTDNERFAYRFKVNSKNVWDNTIKTSDGRFNLTTDPSRPALALPHTMYHMMPDFFNPGSDFDSKTGDGLLTGKLMDLKNLPRNHANKYGGTINGITNKLDYIKDLGVARILSTPIFGQDRFPTGYWTTNPLQVTSTMGSMTDFKNLHKELFKRGMGWVADGAFVNEGWEGIHLKDVMLYGEKSPFYYWFETHNFPLEPMKPGVLPTNPEAYKNLGVKIVNGKHWIDKEGVQHKNDKFNPKMPTYIQVYDKRLATDDQIKDVKNLIGDYENLSYEDNKKMSTYRDVTLPYSFEVKPGEVEDRIKNWKESGKTEALPKKGGIIDVVLDILKLILSVFGINIGTKKSPEAQKDSLRDHLLAFPRSGDRPNSGLKFVRSDQDGGVTLWDGNKDIAKLRFTVPSGKRREILKNKGADELKKIERATIQVQDNIIKVGGYWTNEVDKSLTEYSAREIGKKFAELKKSEFEKIKSNIPGFEKKEFDSLKKEEKYLAAIYILADEQADKPKHIKGPNKTAMKLPANLRTLIKKQELTAEHVKNMLKNDYNIGSIAAPESVADAVMSFPLDAIEFPAEICSILSSPYIKEIANYKKPDGSFGFDIKRLDPDQKAVYSDMRDLYTEKVVPMASEILKKVDKDKKLFDGQNLTPEGKEVFRLISGDIVKYIMVKALADVKPAYDKDTKEFKYADLRETTFMNMAQLNRTSPEAAARSVVYSLKEGLKRVKEDESDFVENLSDKIKDINPETVKAAKLVINKTESGLDWRIDAAKDIGDIDAIRDEKATFSETWEDVIGFWKKFNTEVRNYNPKSYTIGEVTDVRIIMHKNPKNENDFSLPDNGRFKEPTDAERQFVGEAGFTTQSNYNFLYSKPHALYHGMPEDKADYSRDNDSGKNVGSIGANIDEILNKFSESGPIDNVLLSHTFFTNHDKPRTFHSLTLNIGDFYHRPGTMKLAKCFQDEKLSNGQSVFDIVDNAFANTSNEGHRNWWNNLDKIDKLNQLCSSIDNSNWIYDDGGNHIKDYLNAPGSKISVDEFRSSFNKALEKYNDEFGKIKDKVQGSGNVMRLALCNAIDSANINSQDATKLKTAIDKFADNQKAAAHFARRPFERNLQDIANEANVKLSQKDIKSIHEAFIKPGITKFKSMMTLLTYMPGNPTIYAGDELAQTGYETKNKNVDRQNRDRNKWEYINKDSADYRESIDKLQKDVAKTINLRNDSRLTPLVDGYSIDLGKQADSTVGIYRYNKDRDIIALISNKDFGNTTEARGFSENGGSLKPIHDGKNIIRLNNIKWSLGVKGDDGIVRDTSNSPVKYKSTDNNETYLLKQDDKGYYIENENGEIIMNKPNLLLYREKPFTA